MSKETPLKILNQGQVKVVGTNGYLLARGENCACFYVDVMDRAYVDFSSYNHETGCPTVTLYETESMEEFPTTVEFLEFPGWKVHSTNSGKTIAIALINFDNLFEN